MPFDPSTVQPDSASPARPGGFDPSTAQEVVPPSKGEEFAIGVGRGLAGDVVGAGQVVGHFLPSAITDPVAASSGAQWLTRQANAPTSGGFETAGRIVGSTAPLLLQPELGLGSGIAEAVAAGAIGGAVQPTKSGSLLSHLGGAATGASLGGILGSLGAGPARQLMRQLGVRLTPGRMIPLIGQEWERFVAGLPVVNRLVGHGRQISLDDFQRALYRDAQAPLPGLPPITETGSAGLEQLRNNVAGRLNNVLARSDLPAANVMTLRGDIGNIVTNAMADLNPPALTRLGRIIQDDIDAPIALNGGQLPGARLAGRNGVIAKLNSRARMLWRSNDTQDKALANVIDQLEEAVLNNANIGGGGRAELDAARQAYARYKTLSRAGGGSTAEGQIDPNTLLAELRRENPDLFARGGMRLQNVATQARNAGVPTIAETAPQISRWETGAGLAGTFFRPDIALGAVAPSTLYNDPGMAFINWLASQARRLGSVGGVAGGQGAPAAAPKSVKEWELPTMTVTPADQ